MSDFFIILIGFSSLLWLPAFMGRLFGLIDHKTQGDTSVFAAGFFVMWLLFVVVGIIDALLRKGIIG